jgi:hypothetical protein
MKKILVFICLMFISSSVFAIKVEGYKNLKELAPENKFAEGYLKGTIRGTHEGLMAMLAVIMVTEKKLGTKSNVEVWCPPNKIALNHENLIDILDKQVELTKSRGKKMGKPDDFGDEIPIAYVLRQGLLQTFPCE